MLVLRGRTAAAKKEERDDRPTRKLVEKHAAKIDRKVEKVAKKAVEKEEKAAARVVCGALCGGTKQKPGKLASSGCRVGTTPASAERPGPPNLGQCSMSSAYRQRWKETFLQALSEPQ